MGKNMKLGIVMRWECLKWKYEYLLNGNTGTPEVCGYFTEIFIILKWRVFFVYFRNAHCQNIQQR